jgi:hypothetical protein
VGIDWHDLNLPVWPTNKTPKPPTEKTRKLQAGEIKRKECTKYAACFSVSVTNLFFQNGQLSTLL